MTKDAIIKTIWHHLQPKTQLPFNPKVKWIERLENFNTKPMHHESFQTGVHMCTVSSSMRLFIIQITHLSFIHFQNKCIRSSDQEFYHRGRWSNTTFVYRGCQNQQTNEYTSSCFYKKRFAYPDQQRAIIGLHPRHKSVKEVITINTLPFFYNVLHACGG